MKEQRKQAIVIGGGLAGCEAARHCRYAPRTEAGAL